MLVLIGFLSIFTLMILMRSGYEAVTSAYPPLVVRQTRTAAEEEALHRATARVFGRPDADASVGAGADRWRTRVEEARVSYPAHLRAAFAGATFVGSYVMYERELRFGPGGEARLRTGGIAVVLTEPEHRLKGVARALMRDAVRLARKREWAPRVRMHHQRHGSPADTRHERRQAAVVVAVSV